MVTLEEGHYQIKLDSITISMVINFKNLTYTMQTAHHKCDFVFLDTKPEYALKVLAAMQEATEFAVSILKEHAPGDSGGIGEKP